VLEPLAIAGAIAITYLVWAPLTTDFAAQTFRADLFEEHGLTIWNNAWFGGHHTPGYSVLFPPVAALLTPRIAAGLAVVVAAGLFDVIVREHWGERARIGSLWFAATFAASLFTGRLTFCLGVALALGAVLAAQREREGLAGFLAIATVLASPVAGLFLALAAGARALELEALRARDPSAWRPALVAVLAFGGVLLLTSAFPEGGKEPFPFSSFWPPAAFSVAVLALVPRDEEALRVGAWIYLAALVAAYAIDTPMGSNAVRLGTVAGPPLLACALAGRRSAALAALAVPLLAWQLLAPVQDVAKARHDPSVHAAYYDGLTAFLDDARRSHPEPFRVEVVMTRNHWEAVHVAERFPLARGWVRQLDEKYDELFYEDPLTAQEYRRWLRSLAVRYVALPDVKLDFAARRERDLITRRRPPYLREVWRDAHWRVFQVAGAGEMVASGRATMTSMSSGSFRLLADTRGTVDVRVRWTPYWNIEHGSGCVEKGPGDFTRLRLRSSGEVRVASRFAPGRVFSRGPRCT
jgi:hypothetical protein